MKLDDYLKTFKDLDYPTKLLVIGVSVIAPIWFLDIRIFYRHYKLDEIYVPIVMSYCMAIALLIGGVWLATGVFKSITAKEAPTLPLFAGIIFSTTQLLTWSLIAYWDSFKFMTLIYWLFGCIFITGVSTNISRMIKNKKKENSNSRID